MRSSRWCGTVSAFGARSSGCRISQRALQAAVCDFLPGKPFSTDNYRSLLVDSVGRTDGFARLGIRPQPFSAVLPRYLG